MDARLHITSVGSEPIAELSIVSLLRGMSVPSLGYLPEGSHGTVVSVYEGGAAYEVEFETPFHALVTLESACIGAIPELSRDRIIAAAKDF